MTDLAEHLCPACGSRFAWTGREWYVADAEGKTMLTRPRKPERQAAPHITRCPACHAVLPQPVGTVAEDRA